jgi:hypothetical protein
MGKRTLRTLSGRSGWVSEYVGMWVSHSLPFWLQAPDSWLLSDMQSRPRHQPQPPILPRPQRPPKHPALPAPHDVIMAQARPHLLFTPAFGRHPLRVLISLLSLCVTRRFHGCRDIGLFCPSVTPRSFLTWSDATSPRVALAFRCLHRFIRSRAAFRTRSGCPSRQRRFDSRTRPGLFRAQSAFRIRSSNNLPM